MIRHQQKMQCFGFFEEAIGTLTELNEGEEILNARINEVVLALPAKMEDKLRPLIGTRIGILRTDIPQKEYLVCSISESESLALEEKGSISSTSSEVSQEADRGKARA